MFSKKFFAVGAVLGASVLSQYSYANYWSDRAKEQMKYATDVSGLSQTSSTKYTSPEFNWLGNVSRGTFRLDMDSVNHPLHCNYTKTGWLPSEDFVDVGISDDWFNAYSQQGHNICGQCIRITNLDNGNTVNGMINDRGHVAGSGGYVRTDTLDLSMPAFLALRGDFNDNMKNLAVEPIVCEYPEGTKLTYFVEDTSAPDYYFSLLIEQLPIAIAGVEVKDRNGEWVDMFMDSHNRWGAPNFALERNQGWTYLRITGNDGSIFEDSFYYKRNGDRMGGSKLISEWEIIAVEDSADAEPEPLPEPLPEPSPEPAPIPAPIPTSEPVPTPEPVPAPEPVPTPEPIVVPDPELPPVDYVEFVVLDIAAATLTDAVVDATDEGTDFVAIRSSGALSWAFDAEVSAMHRVDIYYRSPYDYKEQLLEVNEDGGVIVGFEQTAEWEKVSIEASLEEGANTLSLLAKWGWMDVGKIVINAPE